MLQIAFHPKFLSSRVEKERRAILSELQMMNTIDYRVDCQVRTREVNFILSCYWICITKHCLNFCTVSSGAQLLQHLHSENKLSKRFPIGLEEQIKKWDVDKVRKFHERWYFPANATLYIVGDIENISKTVYQIEVCKNSSFIMYSIYWFTSRFMDKLIFTAGCLWTNWPRKWVSTYS